MKACFVSLWLLSVLGTSTPEEVGLRAARQGRHGPAMVWLAMAQTRSRKRRESRGAWRSARVRLRYLAGRTALRWKRPKTAIPYLRKASRRAWLLRESTLYYLGRAYQRAGRWAEAAKTYRLWLKSFGGRKRRREVRKRLWVVLRAAKNWRAEAEHIKKLLWYPRPYGGRKALLWRLAQNATIRGIQKEARQRLRQFVLEYPKTKESVEAKRLLRRWKQPTEANNEQERLYQITRLSRLQPAKAVTPLKAWIRSLSPKNKAQRQRRQRLRYLLARAYMRKRRYRDALQIWKALPKDKLDIPQRRYAIYAQGRCHVELGEHQAALNLLHPFAEREPESRTARLAAYKAAWAAMRLQRYAKARKLFQEYRTVYPEYRKTARDLRWLEAWSLFREGRYYSAIRAFKAWARRMRTLSAKRRVTYWIARAEERRRRWPRARKAYASLAQDAAFSYYGILAQHRLYLMQQEIPRHARVPACQRSDKQRPTIEALAQQQKRRRYKKRNKRRKRHRRKRRTKTTTQRKKQFTYRPFALNAKLLVDTALRLPQRRDKKRYKRRNTSKGKVQSSSATQPAQPFPEPPRACRYSRSRGCQSFKLASILHELGFDRDAARALYKAKRVLYKHPPLLRDAARWFYAQGAHHQALRLALKIRYNPKAYRLVRPRELYELLYQRPFAASMQRQCRRFDVPASFGWAIMRQESHFLVKARSWVGAIGLMQIMPYTGRKIARRLKLASFQPSQLKQPPVNIQMGCWYLGQLLQKFQGNVLLAAASYNAGPHRVANWLRTHSNVEADEFVEEITFRETRKYVKNVFRNYVLYQFLYGRPLPQPPGAVAVRVGTNINF